MMFGSESKEKKPPIEDVIAIGFGKVKKGGTDENDDEAKSEDADIEHDEAELEAIKQLRAAKSDEDALEAFKKLVELCGGY